MIMAPSRCLVSCCPWGSPGYYLLALLGVVNPEAKARAFFRVDPAPILNDVATENPVAASACCWHRAPFSRTCRAKVARGCRLQRQARDSRIRRLFRKESAADASPVLGISGGGSWSFRHQSSLEQGHLPPWFGCSNSPHQVLRDLACTEQNCRVMLKQHMCEPIGFFLRLLTQ